MPTITKQQIAEQIRKEFAEFLAKHNLEVCITEEHTGMGFVPSGIEFSWYSERNAENELIKEGGELNIGNWADKDSV